MTSFEILLPSAEAFAIPDPEPIGPRLSTLDGARIGLVANSFPACAGIFAQLEASFKAVGATTRLVHREYWRTLTEAELDELCAASDAVVVGMGLTPPGSIWCVEDASGAERRGVPAVVGASTFYGSAVADASRMNGMPELRRVLLAHPLPVELNDLTVVVEAAFPAVAAALTSDDAPAEALP